MKTWPWASTTTTAPGFTAGTYRIEVYADGRLAGQSDIVLR